MENPTKVSDITKMQFDLISNAASNACTEKMFGSINRINSGEGIVQYDNRLVHVRSKLSGIRHPKGSL